MFSIFPKLADILMQENYRLKLITQVHLSIFHYSITIKCFLNTAHLDSTVMSGQQKNQESLP